MNYRSVGRTGWRISETSCGAWAIGGAWGKADDEKVGILARVPLASGLLSWKMSTASKFAEDDHRNCSRHGEAFDRGETFSGVDFETGLSAVEQLKKLVGN